ncbi:hypothetical protein CYMTET_46926 [Cymbomonas tetramitiformis]|uniref:Uncharacterized protein n=1 Tax=Cymbomonas tetramitiformis TaxID=36881 RepID=A0AAE0BV64_9CHLO|nr:hypothetical protein CYMTET_46927 [Cymbomonas tetramitiformis]KAK3243418.1 hypothetical protein CYMTET_46926 [Cymbomonas tetramitiformis]
MVTVSVSASQKVLICGALVLGLFGFILAFFGLISAEDKCDGNCDNSYRLAQFSAWLQLFVYVGIAGAAFSGKTAQYTVIILTFLAICSTLCIFFADKGITEADQYSNDEDKETAASCYACGFVFCTTADFLMIVILGLQVQNLEGAVKSDQNPMYQPSTETPAGY